MKKIWLSTLLKIYAYIMVAIITLMGIVVAVVSWQSQVSEADRIANRVSARVVTEIENSYQRARQAGQSLVENPAKLEGIYRYFTLTPSEYESWRLNTSIPDYIQVSLHRNIENLYIQNAEIEEIDLSLTDYTQVFVSSRQSKGGRQLPSSQYQASSTAIPVTLTDPSTGTAIGLVYIQLDQSILTSAIDNTRGDIPVAVQIYTPLDKLYYHKGDDHLPQGTHWLTKNTVYDYQVRVAVPSSYIVRTAMSNLFLVLSVAAFLVLILYLSLQRIFHGYREQVSDLVTTIQEISKGDSKQRIDTAHKNQELLLVSSNINSMLDHLDANIRDIYELQILQQDANMRALQAQINPHFMYNTLEFIRMYAVMHEQEELGDIIYEFSSLLRNNISDERTTTLENELEFCRKYSYLCMVRYPKSVAYGFKMDPGLEDMRIPKFTIQPLVENYFAHGIDHRQMDNVISVKALKRDDGVEIIIEDNGRGMKAEQLQSIRHLLEQRTFSHQEQRKSIGIVNVHERMVLFFGDRYQIQVDSEENKGVTYHIFIKNEREKDV